MSVVVAFGVSVAVGLVFGIVPASRRPSRIRSSVSGTSDTSRVRSQLPAADAPLDTASLLAALVASLALAARRPAHAASPPPSRSRCRTRSRWRSSRGQRRRSRAASRDAARFAQRRVQRALCCRSSSSPATRRTSITASTRSPQPDGIDAVRRPVAEPVDARPRLQRRRFRSPAARSPSARRSAASTHSATTRHQVLSDVAVRRQLQQDLFKPRDVVWDERVQSLERERRRAGVSRGARRRRRHHRRRVLRPVRAADVARERDGNVAVNDTLYTLNKGRFEVGKIGENDLLKSELALLRARAARRRRQARARSRRGRAAPAARLSRGPGRSRSSRRTRSRSSTPTPTSPCSEALKNSSAMEQNELDDTCSAGAASTTAKLNNRFNATIVGERRLQSDRDGVRPARIRARSASSR